MTHLSTDPVVEPTLLRIHEVASELGLTTRAIRYYEELGLLKPAARSEGSYRLFDTDDIERLRFIKGLRDDAGFGLAEIGRLLEDEAVRERNRARFRASTDRAERRALLGESLERVEDQIGRLQAKIDRLRAMVEEAEGRRDHLRDHIRDLDAGIETPPHAHGRPGATR